MKKLQGNLFTIQIDGRTAFYADQKDQLKSALPDFFSCFISKAHYWGDEGIKQLLNTALWLVQEMGLGKMKIKQLESAITNYKREKALQLIFNVILANEGHGNLPGFGLGEISIEEGRRRLVRRTFVNPEKESIHLATKYK